MNAVDTNILVYAVDEHDPAKRQQARDFLRQSGQTEPPLLMWQVLRRIPCVFAALGRSTRLRCKPHSSILQVNHPSHADRISELDSCGNIVRFTGSLQFVTLGQNVVGDLYRCWCRYALQRRHGRRNDVRLGENCQPLRKLVASQAHVVGCQTVRWDQALCSVFANELRDRFSVAKTFCVAGSPLSREVIRLAINHRATVYESSVYKRSSGSPR